MSNNQVHQTNQMQQRNKDANAKSNQTIKLSKKPLAGQEMVRVNRSDWGLWWRSSSCCYCYCYYLLLLLLLRSMMEELLLLRQIFRYDIYLYDGTIWHNIMSEYCIEYHIACYDLEFCGIIWYHIIVLAALAALHCHVQLFITSVDIRDITSADLLTDLTYLQGDPS